MGNFLKKSIALMAMVLSIPEAQAVAESAQVFSLIDSTPVNQTWLNAGFYSYHLQRDKGLQDSNPGLGIEQRFSTVTSLTAGRFYNSDRRYSNYAGVYYQPIAAGPFRFGAVVGVFNGYPKMRNGGLFLAAIPVATFEHTSVGVNVAFIPGYRNRLYGAVASQLKFKVWD